MIKIKKQRQLKIYQPYSNSERVENILMPIRDGLMICQKINETTFIRKYRDCFPK